MVGSPEQVVVSLELVVARTRGKKLAEPSLFVTRKDATQHLNWHVVKISRIP